MPADPAAVPPPEWAVEMAKTVGDCGSYHDFDGACCVEIVNRIARLLASVREGALREAAAKCNKIVDVAARLAKTNRKFVDSSAYYRGMEMGAFSASEDILALLHTPPSGGCGA